MAIGAIKEHGPVTLLDPDEVPDDALIVPIAMMGAPTVLCEKGIGGNEYQVLYDMVSKFYGKSIYAFMPIEAGGVNSMRPSPPPRVWVCPWWTVTAWTGLPGAPDGYLHHRRRQSHPYGADRRKGKQRHL